MKSPEEKEGADYAPGREALRPYRKPRKKVKMSKIVMAMMLNSSKYFLMLSLPDMAISNHEEVRVE